MGLGAYFVHCYGVAQFLNDVDKGREYWREADNIVSDVLSWCCEEGFEKFFGAFEDVEMPYRTPHEYRQRHILGALRSLFKVKNSW